MQHDMKLGLAFAILSVGLVTAFWVRDAGVSADALPRLLPPESAGVASLPPAPYPHAVLDESTTIADEPWALPAYPEAVGRAGTPSADLLNEPRSLPVDRLPELPPAFGFDVTPVEPSDPTPQFVATAPTGRKRGGAVPVRTIASDRSTPPVDTPVLSLPTLGGFDPPEVPTPRNDFFTPSAEFAPSVAVDPDDLPMISADATPPVLIGTPEPFAAPRPRVRPPVELLPGRIEPWVEPATRYRPEPPPTFVPPRVTPASVDDGPAVAWDRRAADPVGRPGSLPFVSTPAAGGSATSWPAGEAVWNRDAKRDDAGSRTPVPSGPRSSVSADLFGAETATPKAGGSGPDLLRGCRPTRLQ